MLSPEDIKKRIPQINLQCRFPVAGGFIQNRAGMARHDAVVWGYARAASAAGVDIIQNCEVVAMDTAQDRVSALQTTRGRFSADRFALCVAGHSGQLAAMAGLRLPIQSVALQAMVSEPVKPVLDVILMSAHIHVYVSQTDRGEILIGGGTDPFSSYAQRGAWSIGRENMQALLELLPMLGRLRLMRQWAGCCDMAPDVSPIVGKTPVENLYISTGWGTGGYKAIPAGGDTLAHTIVNDENHPLLNAFGLDRFDRGALLDEGAASGVAH